MAGTSLMSGKKILYSTIPDNTCLHDSGDGCRVQVHRGGQCIAQRRPPQREWGGCAARMRRVCQGWPRRLWVLRLLACTELHIT